MLNFLTLKPEVLGIDISDLSIKVVKLKKKGSGFVLESFGESDVAPGLIDRGEIKDQEALAGAVREALLRVKGKKTNTRYVVASLPEERAFLQVISMPKMDEKELAKAVAFEAENYVPIPIKDLYLDFQVVSPISNGLDHADVLIAALPKEVVDPYVSCLNKAGLVPIALEIESLAIARALVRNEASPFPLLLVDCGSTRTGFIIFSGYSLRFTSSIPVSSQELTGAVARNLKVDVKKAEELKLKYGIDMQAKEKESREVFESLIPALTDLKEQLKVHLTYYQSHASHEHLAPDTKGVSQIYLCGGGANLKGLTNFLSLELKIPVKLGDPWINILSRPLEAVPIMPYEESLKYTTVLGLALRGAKYPEA